MERKNKIDWVGEYYRAIRDCGEDDTMLLGQINKDSTNSEPHWFEVHHDECDGIGMLVSLLRNQGFCIDKLPVLKNNRQTFFRTLQGLITYISTDNVRWQQWRLPFDRNSRCSTLPVNKRVFWHLVTKEQTEKINSVAKAANVTTNSYLLFHLDKTVASLMTAMSTSRRWAVPINLRGGINRPRPTELSVHSTFLTVDIDDADTPKSIHERIVKLKEKNYHWGSWFGMTGGFLFGKAGLRKFLQKREKEGHDLTGLFSNLGSWEIPHSGNWLACPLVTRMYPIGVGCITMNGCLSIAIQLHAAFGEDPQLRQSLMEAWKQSCLNE